MLLSASPQGGALPVQLTSQRLDSFVSTDVVFGGYSETARSVFRRVVRISLPTGCHWGALRFMLSRRHASIRGFDFVQTGAKDKGGDTRVTVAIPNNASGNFDATTIWEFKATDESNVTTADIGNRKDVGKPRARQPFAFVVYEAISLKAWLTFRRPWPDRQRNRSQKSLFKKLKQGPKDYDEEIVRYQRGARRNQLASLGHGLH